MIRATELCQAGKEGFHVNYKWNSADGGGWIPSTHGVHNVSSNGTVSTCCPLLQPWPCGNICGEGRIVQFPKHKLFLWGQDVSILFELLACSNVLLHTLYFPCHLLRAPKGEDSATSKRNPYRVSMKSNVTKLGTGNPEIEEFVPCLTKLNYVFKRLSPLYPKIGSNMIYRSCRNSIWGRFLSLWPQEQNSVVLGTIMVLKQQSCPQAVSSEVAAEAFLTHYPHDQASHKMESQAHRERLAPWAHPIPVCSFISWKKCFLFAFPTYSVTGSKRVVKPLLLFTRRTGLWALSLQWGTKTVRQSLKDQAGGAGKTIRSRDVYRSRQAWV